MNLEKYTQKSQEALLAAQRLAQDYQHQVIEPIHLLLAVLATYFIHGDSQVIQLG